MGFSKIFREAVGERTSICFQGLLSANTAEKLLKILAQAEEDKEKYKKKDGGGAVGVRFPTA